MTDQPTVNILVEMVDGEGREWKAAGYLGPLVRYEDGQQVESLLPGHTRDREMRLQTMKIIERREGE